MRTEPAQSASQRHHVGNATVWFALLGGPVAWVAHFLASYWMAYAPCGPRLSLLLGATLLAALVAAAALVVSFRLVRDHAGAKRSTRSGRGWFAGYGGLLNSSLFLLIILVEGAAPLILSQCP